MSTLVDVSNVVSTLLICGDLRIGTDLPTLVGPITFHLDVIHVTETKARIAVVYLYFRKYVLKRLKYRNYITFDEIKRIERKIGKVPTHVKSSILKSLGLRKNKNKKRWKFIDSKMRKRIDGWLSEITQILENIEGS